MSTARKVLLGIVGVIVVLGLVFYFVTRPDVGKLTTDQLSGPKPPIEDPDPQTIPTIVTAKPVGWKAGETPVAAQGLQVAPFAVGLDHPRTMLVLPNGDVLVAETNSQPRDTSGITGFVMKWLMNRVGAGGSSPDRIQLLRDTNGDGRADSKTLFRSGLKSPFGMALRDDGKGGQQLLVANTDAVLSFPFKVGETTLTGAPTKLMDLPGNGNHWARNLLLSPDGSKLYVTVGSSSNIAENGIEAEKGRAAIHEYDFVKGNSRIYASGLRNPNGLDFNPYTGELWTVVNERDQLGSDLVPDYLTNVPFGASYGWPWVYWKDKMDDRVDAPMPQYFFEYVRKPEYALGAHVAPLGLAFARPGNLMGPAFANGAFIARHGSWNRKPLSGYDVVFVPFDTRGNATGSKPTEVLTGFLTPDQKRTHGRPVWVVFAKDGAMLVSDDVGNAIWRVTAPGAAPAPAITAIKSDPVGTKFNIPDPQGSKGSAFETRN